MEQFLVLVKTIITQYFRPIIHIGLIIFALTQLFGFVMYKVYLV